MRPLKQMQYAWTWIVSRSNEVTGGGPPAKGNDDAVCEVI